MTIINYIKGIKNTTVGTLAIAMVATIIFAGGYRTIIKPQFTKRERLEAEKYANYLFEQELLKKQQPQHELPKY